MMADITEQAFGSLVEEQKKTTNSLSNVRSLLKQQTDLQYAVTDSQKEGLKIDRAMQQAAQDNYRKNAQDKAKDDSQASKEAEDEDKKGILNKKMLSFLKKMSDGLTDMGKSLAEKYLGCN
jgi:DNA-binding winged helix-turn-helix (wHTH) protein